MLTLLLAFVQQMHSFSICYFKSDFVRLLKVDKNKISKRAISTGQLNDLHQLHTQPIKLIVYKSS